MHESKARTSTPAGTSCGPKAHANLRHTGIPYPLPAWLVSPTRPGSPQAGGASQSRRPLLGFTYFHTRFTSSSQHLPVCTGMAPAHARTKRHPARPHIQPLGLSAQAPPRPTLPALPQLLRPRPLQTRAGFEVRPLVRASVVARAGIAGRRRAGAAGLRAARAARAWLRPKRLGQRRRKVARVVRHSYMHQLTLSKHEPTPRAAQMQWRTPHTRSSAHLCHFMCTSALLKQGARRTLRGGSPYARTPAGHQRPTA